ncbi:MAG: hypothetical protein ACJ73E_03065, partial [Mycobacteriales bacterium]
NERGTRQEDPMPIFFFGPALDYELAHRRSTLLRDAATHRLARQARRAARTAAPRPVVAQHTLPAAAPVPAEASAGPAGPARDQVTRAA